MRIRTMICLIALFSIPAYAQDAPLDLNVALERLEKNWDGLRSFRAAYTTRMAAPRGAGQRVRVEANGRVEALKEKNVFKYRLDQEVAVLDAEGTVESTTRSVTLYDGEHTFIITDAAGAKTVLVLSPESTASMIPMDAQSLLANLREIGDVKLLPSELINEIPAYVLEGAPLLPAGSTETIQAAKMRVYVDEATGVPLRWVLLDTAGDPVAEGAYSNIEINPELDPKQFVFDPPVGASVIDMRAPGNAPAAPEP